MFLDSYQTTTLSVNKMAFSFAHAGFRDTQKPAEVTIKLAFKAFGDIGWAGFRRIHDLQSKPSKLSGETQSMIRHSNRQIHRYLPDLQVLKAISHRNLLDRFLTKNAER